MFIRLRAKDVGTNNERIAQRYLEQRGLTFVCKNYHSRYGEIDLIFNDTHNDTLVFVEVRYRQSSNFGNSIETINLKKQKKIIKTASYYLHQHNLSEKVNCRFDVIGIEPNKNIESQESNSINWIKNAFMST